MKSMKRTYLMLLALMSAGAVYAAGDDAASKNAADRYADDQKLCAEESNSSRRMQCLRDAKEEYNKALGAPEGATKAAASPAPAPVCKDCGKVTAVKVTEKEGKGSPVGMIAGGVVGGLLGNQIGAGRGKTVATVAGAAGGAYAGNKIEGKMNSTKTWAVSVRFDNGDERVFNFESDPGYAAGDPVRASGSGIVRR
jgi:outer membrane lipoprotein SlyB